MSGDGGRTTSGRVWDTFCIFLKMFWKYVGHVWDMFGAGLGRVWGVFLGTKKQTYGMVDLSKYRFSK